MNIVLTGSLGHISKPLATTLIVKGHTVTIISSNPERQKDIEKLGAKAAIGTVENKSFLAETFTNADAVYCMAPPNFTSPNQIDYYQNMGKIYKEVILATHVKRVVHLSSYGAHLPSGTGFITGSYKIEQELNSIPNTNLTHVRPTYFYYNLLSFIPMIKSVGFIGSVYGGDDKLAMVSPKDIAVAVSEELEATVNTKKVRYVCSDDRTCSEIATVLGKSIGIPDLKWRVLAKEQVLQSLIKNGMPENFAFNLVELGEAIHSGILREQFEQDLPPFGNVKLEGFTEEFTVAYNHSNNFNH